MIECGGCPKCSGHLFVAGNTEGWHRVCLNCEFRRDLNQSLIDASNTQQGSRVVDISKSMHEKKMIIDKDLEELERLSSEYEEMKSGFEKKLRDLDEEEGEPPRDNTLNE